MLARVKLRRRSMSLGMFVIMARKLRGDMRQNVF
jgi:hypothetical protein